MTDDPGLQELVHDFVTESREHLGSVEADLLSLEAKPSAASETINRVFRGVHSVKGVAGFLGFDNINKLAHSLESVLDLVRKERLGMSPELADVLLGATDRLRDLIEHVADSNGMAIDDQIGSLQRFLDPGLAPRPKAAAVEVGSDEWLLQLSLVLPRIALAACCPAAAIVEIVGRLGRVAQGGTDLCARAQGEPSRDPVVVQLVTANPPETVRTQLHLEADEIVVLQARKGSGAPDLAQAAQPQPMPAATTPVEHEPGAEPRAVDRPEPVPANSATDKPKPEPAKRDVAVGASADTHADSIRVSVHLLDRLMNLSGELVLGRNQLLQARSSGNEKGLAVASARLSQVVSEVQEAVMQTRMQPIGTLFQRFPRVVRDLASKLGKRCRLDIEGKDVDLDRSILEALSDPLTHLVRNSVDHGMEMPEQRRQAGKQKEGVVRLGAAQQGGNVRIEISDDGRGIDPVRLKKKALEKGLITPEQAQSMSDREAVHLIFAPGFSTAEKVTDVSGRGVGMDVVRSNIERLGGHVDVDSVVGKGTTIAITIPLTLAILPAMVVSCGARRYVLAQANVAELVRVRGGEGAARIVAMNGREVLRLRGHVLPLLRLRTILGEPQAAPGEDSTIIVVEAANLRYGLVVDAPPDAEEIVVKPLGRHLKKRIEYAGATILGDGRVAMILDASGLAEAGHVGVASAAPEVAEVAETKDQETADLVLFRNHPGETFAVPLGLVERIQRVAGTEIQEVGGQAIYAEGERVLPIVRLESVVRARPVEPTARVSVLVLRLDRQQFGVVAPTIEDIQAMTVRIDDRTLAEPGVLGSFQLKERTVRLLDPTAMAKKALPQLFVDAPPTAAVPATAAPKGPARVLFAEDTKFFREHVTRVLRGAGFDVTPAADGELAWQELQKDGARFDIVVSDIQMPNCDGIELTRRIRREERLRSLPVVALTSLSSKEHEAEGLAAGVSAYLVKLDDSALIAAVRQHAGVTA
ncbi:MAG: chemotaxis protein CheW [Planctomycetes bacterium]|nr:chemotaxis protein CheW [Planctomycetota bacterium]